MKGTGTLFIIIGVIGAILAGAVFAVVIHEFI
jgi:hypothetical protein